MEQACNTMLSPEGILTEDMTPQSRSVDVRHLQQLGFSVVLTQYGFGYKFGTDPVGHSYATVFDAWWAASEAAKAMRHPQDAVPPQFAKLDAVNPERRGALWSVGYRVRRDRHDMRFHFCYRCDQFDEIVSRPHRTEGDAWEAADKHARMSGKCPAAPAEGLTSAADEIARRTVRLHAGRVLGSLDILWGSVQIGDVAQAIADAVVGGES